MSRKKAAAAETTTEKRPATPASVLAKAAETAEGLARKAHRGQKDRAGRPYIEHVKRVAMACRTAGPAAEAAAWLHDVVEDTATTIEDLERRFPPEVVTVVKAVTRREAETYRDYIKRIRRARNRTAVAVKLADLRDHAKVTPEALNRGLIRRYDDAWEQLTRATSPSTEAEGGGYPSSPFRRLGEQY